MNTHSGHETKEEEQPTLEQRTRKIAVDAGMCQCSCCGCWLYDTPGNFCSFCNGGS